MMRFISWIMLSLSLISCGPQLPPMSEITRAMDNAKGLHISSMIEIFGPFYNTRGDALGGQIYIWSEESSVRLTNPKIETKETLTRKRRGKYIINSQTVYKPPIVIRKNQAVMFWADADGIIYHWKLQGFKTDEEIEAEQVIGVIVLTLCLVAIVIKYQEDRRQAEFIEGLID